MNELATIDPQEAAEQPDLLKMLPNFIREKINFLQDSYFERDEDDLVREIFKGGKPDLLSSRLKLNFWEEYDQARKKGGGQMRVTNIIAGVCTIAQFKKYIGDKTRLAWLIRVPADYRLALADIQELGLAQMREILCMDNYNAKGDINVKLLDVKFKIYQHSDMRVKGAIIQRIDQRNLNMNVNANANTEENPAKVALSMDEIEKRLTDLKRKSDSMLAPGGVQVDLMAEISPEKDIIDINAKKDGH